MITTYVCGCVWMSPGESVDEMRLLEEQARKLAEDVKGNQPKQKNVMFVK